MFFKILLTTVKFMGRSCSELALESLYVVLLNYFVLYIIFSLLKQNYLSTFVFLNFFPLIHHSFFDIISSFLIVLIF